MILTRGHRYDQICLEKIAAKEHAYIGMIGSRRRTALVKQSLAEKGVDQEVLDAVYTPVWISERRHRQRSEWQLLQRLLK